MTDAQVARGVVSGADVHYGGFWRRFIAFIVDWFLVSSAVAIVFLLPRRSVSDNWQQHRAADPA